ncbi:MAG: KpsF/GutQ family sugar-phosphate isomerase [Armatimonadetes bacterium]|nr:KpsF/GutQ family sugar-phosphate isomerase [Armatimonadota bacterium]
MRDRLDADFARAVRLVLTCPGKVVVTGMGKSGAVGRKIAGTLSSTGTTAVFLHPAEGIHGDLGILAAPDLLIALSQSGETDELLALLPSVKRIGAGIIAMTGAPGSTLARYAQVVLDTSVEKEACPLNLAPTTSTTCQMALGDALALCVMQAREFSEADYALYHPGGSLGRRLLLRVSEVMRTGDQLALAPLGAPLREVIFKITQANAGAAVVVDPEGRIAGIITDGDLRRYLLRGDHALSDPVDAAMTPNPTITAPDVLAAEALGIINDRANATGVKIGEVPVVDADRRPVGILMLKDMARAGIMF